MRRRERVRKGRARGDDKVDILFQSPRLFSLPLFCFVLFFALLTILLTVDILCRPSIGILVLSWSSFLLTLPLTAYKYRATRKGNLTQPTPVRHYPQNHHSSISNSDSYIPRRQVNGSLNNRPLF